MPIWLQLEHHGKRWAAGKSRCGTSKRSICSVTEAEAGCVFSDILIFCHSWCLKAPSHAAASLAPSGSFTWLAVWVPATLWSTLLICLGLFIDLWRSLFVTFDFFLKCALKKNPKWNNLSPLFKLAGNVYSHCVVNIQHNALQLWWRHSVIHYADDVTV